MAPLKRNPASLAADRVPNWFGWAAEHSEDTSGWLGEQVCSRASASEEAERRRAKLPSLQWGEFSRLMELGVPAPALVWPELPARASVVFDRRRPLFDFAEEAGDEGAISAFLFLARDEVAEPADLVAWAPRENRLAAWFGAIALLGAEDLWAPRLTKERALPVFESPLEWLRAGREGVVVIDPRGAAPPLRLAEPLVVGSIEHGEKLRCMLKVKPPRIFVASPDVRSAA